MRYAAPVQAFLLGYVLADLALDYWLQPAQKDANGFYIKPNLTNYTEYCREGTGNFWTATESACGSIAFGDGLAEGGSDWRGVQNPVNNYAVNENVREDFSWLSPNYHRDYRVALLYRIDPNGSAIGDPIPMGGFVEIPRPAEDIYSSKGPVPEPAPVDDTRFAISENPSAALASVSGFSTPWKKGPEKKKQATGKIAIIGRMLRLGIGLATETCDFVEAMYDAIPENTRVRMGYQYEKVTYKRAAGPTVQRLSKPTRTFKVDTGGGFYRTEKRVVETKLVKKKPPILKDGLGNKIVDSKRLSRISCTRQAKAFINNPRLLDEVDFDKAMENFIKNQFQDWAIGQANSRTNKAYLKAREANGSNYSPFSFGTGSAF